MANAGLLVLSIVIAVGILLVLSVLFMPSSSFEVVGGDSQAEMVSIDSNIIVTRVYDDFEDGCLRTLDQVRMGGNCDYPVNEEKKCYRIEKRECKEVKVGVSCYSELEQVK